MGVRGVTPEHGPDAAPRPAPPLDPELVAALAAAGPAAREPVTLAGLADRQQRDAAARPRPTVRELRAEGRFEVEELRAPAAPDGREVRLVSARPAGADRPLPLLYYLHGGGMIMGNPWSVLPRLLRDWALPLQLAVVSVEYRLAPQARYPGPVEDCYAGLVWAAEQAARLGVDSDRVVVGGKSAGGGLAAALALLTRDRGGPVPIGQLLLSPMLDDRNDSFSGHQMAGRDTWDRVSNATAWQALLGDRYGAADLPPYAAPARAADLAGLPPAYLDVGSAETFRDEAVAYANAIWQAGGEAELHVWPGACHGFDTLAPRAALTRDAHEARTRWLRRIISRSPALPASAPGGRAVRDVAERARLASEDRAPVVGGSVDASAALVAFVSVTDLDRAERFYGGVLGLALRDERPFALVAQAGGATLRITAVDAVAAAPYTVLGWTVPDLDAAVDDLVARGVGMRRYAGLGQDERGAWSSPSGARVAWFDDPDGNTLSLTQLPGPSSPGADAPPRTGGSD